MMRLVSFRRLPHGRRYHKVVFVTVRFEDTPIFAMGASGKEH